MNEENKTSPLVSIIVPMYQAEKTIVRCLDSLVNQTLNDIEIIIVNDGSTDNGPEIVKEYIKKDKRVHLFSQINAGPGAAINAGMKQASGEYFGLVGADDRVHPEMYLIMYNALIKEKTQMSLCLIRNLAIKKDGTEIELDNPSFPESISFADKDKLLNWFLNSSYIGLSSVCQKLVKRNIFTDNNILYPVDYRYGEDHVVSGLLFCLTPAAAIVSQKLYDYIHIEGSYNNSYSIKTANDTLKNFDDVYRAVINSGYSGTISNYALSMMFSSLKQLYIANLVKDENSKLIIAEWKNRKQLYKWKPKFKNTKTPFIHRTKITISYLNLTRFVCFLIKKLYWIPFFKYLT